MATGLKIPVGVNKSGGAAVETDPVRQKRKLLDLAFSLGDDDNPFQDLGLDRSLIFAVKDEAFEARAIVEVNRILAGFVDLIRISPDVPIEFERETEGEIELAFQYVDLEVDQVEDFTKKFTR